MPFLFRRSGTGQKPRLTRFEVSDKLILLYILADKSAEL
jgi:hypothetical protein